MRAACLAVVLPCVIALVPVADDGSTSNPSRQLAEESECWAAYQECIVNFGSGSVYRSTSFRKKLADDPSKLSLLGCQNTCPSPPQIPSPAPPPAIVFPVHEHLEWMSSATAGVVMSSGELRLWGRNYYTGNDGATIYKLGATSPSNRGSAPGEMGNAMPAIDWGANRTVKMYASKGHVSCAILDDDVLKCFGWGPHGGMGAGSSAENSADGSDVASLAPIDVGSGKHAIRIFAGAYHICTILNTFELKCWGQCQNGACGVDTSGNNIGDDPNEMGDHLPAVDLGTGVIPVHVQTFDHLDASCALLNTGDVKCWGRNMGGNALGSGNSDNIGVTPGQMGDNLAPVDLGTGRKCRHLAVGFGQACCILDDAETKCWGDTTYITNLPSGDDQARGSSPNHMGDNLLAVNFGTGRTATQVAIGGNAGCALLDNGKVKCWGRASHTGTGQSTGNQGDSPSEVGDNWPYTELGTGRSAVHIMAGHHHFCALLDEGSLKCWGENRHGELGYGDTENRGDTPDEMGDSLPTVNLGDDAIHLYGPA